MGVIYKQDEDQLMDAVVNEPIAHYGDLDLTKRYTYGDYLKFQFEERVELIRGFIHKMSPAPRDMHQAALVQMSYLFKTVLKGKPCKIRVAPYDLRLPLPSEKKQYTVVQPDISIYCSKDKIDEAGAFGAPDLVVEILRRNKKHDQVTKFSLYEEAGVPEYWIVDASEMVLTIYELVESKYQEYGTFLEGESFKSATFPELQFEVKELFED